MSSSGSDIVRQFTVQFFYKYQQFVHCLKAPGSMRVTKQCAFASKLRISKEVSVSACVCTLRISIWDHKCVHWVTVKWIKATISIVCVWSFFFSFCCRSRRSPLIDYLSRRWWETLLWNHLGFTLPAFSLFNQLWTFHQSQILNPLSFGFDQLWTFHQCNHLMHKDYIVLGLSACLSLLGASLFKHKQSYVLWLCCFLFVGGERWIVIWCVETVEEPGIYAIIAKLPTLVGSGDKEGHKSKECLKRLCYRCGMPGHLRKDCNNPSKFCL